MMKDKLTLAVKSPCTEKWSHLKQTKKGGYCEVCRKEVIDFSQMSEAEVFNYFRNFSGNVCGRFQPHQLKIYSAIPIKSNRSSTWKWVSAGLASLLLILDPGLVKGSGSLRSKVETFQVLKKQVKKEHHFNGMDAISINGVVKDEENNTLPGVNIYVKGTQKRTITDIDGRFEIEDISIGDVLVFNFIGFETQEYRVTNKSSKGLEILLITLSYDLMGEVTIDHVYKESNLFTNVWNKLSQWF